MSMLYMITKWQEHGERMTPKLRKHGWSTKNVSPFWELLWMRPSFYKCFGICFLHLEYLGRVKHLQYTFMKNPNVATEFNNAVKAYDSFPGKHSFQM